MDKKKIIEAARQLVKGEGSKSRCCKKIIDGEFKSSLPSTDFANLLNEGPGKKIKPKDLTALMQPLLKAGIVKVKHAKGGKGKIWMPGWTDEAEITTEDKGVIFFSGENAWTDSNKKFPTLLEKLKGNLCIIDPYYGFGSLAVLYKFGKNRKIRFLTAQLGNEEIQKETVFKKELQTFLKEFANIEFRLYGKKYELHDRYIIADNGLVIVGGGIKDLARKESFVVFLPKEIIGTHLHILKEGFEERWKKSSELS